MAMLLQAIHDAMDMPLVSESRRASLRHIARCGTAAGVATGVAPLISACSSIRWTDSAPLVSSNLRPPLYRLSAPASYPGTGWLLGSIHAGRADLFPLPRTIIDRFAAADELAVELNIPQRRNELKIAFTERAFLPGGQRLEQILEPQTVQWLKRRFAISDSRWAALSRLQPWAITRALHGSDQTASSRISLGLETHFLELAKTQNKPVRELESANDQIRALAGGSIRWQAALLDDRVRNPQFWDNNLNPLIQAWARGDQAGLLKQKMAAFGTDALRAPLRQRLFSDRDNQMAQRLVSLMREPRSVFAVVGAFHLVGQSSLRTQLRKLGVTIQRIEYPVSQST